MSIPPRHVDPLGSPKDAVADFPVRAESEANSDCLPFVTKAPPRSESRKSIDETTSDPAESSAQGRDSITRTQSFAPSTETPRRLLNDLHPKSENEIAERQSISIGNGEETGQPFLMQHTEVATENEKDTVFSDRLDFAKELFPAPLPYGDPLDLHPPVIDISVLSVAENERLVGPASVRVVKVEPPSRDFPDIVPTTPFSKPKPSADSFFSTQKNGLGHQDRSVEGSTFLSDHFFRAKRAKQTRIPLFHDPSTTFVHLEPDLVFKASDYSIDFSGDGSPVSSDLGSVRKEGQGFEFVKKSTKKKESFFTRGLQVAKQWTAKQLWWIIFLLILVTVGNFLQIIMLNFWLQSFPPDVPASNFTVFALPGVLFFIVFLIAEIGYLIVKKPRMSFAKSLYGNWLLLLIGFMDAINSWMATYGATQTSEVLQALFMNLSPVYAVFMCKWILRDDRRYMNRLVIAVFLLTLLGVVSVTATAFTEDLTLSNFLWITIFFFSIPLRVLMNVWQSLYMLVYTYESSFNEWLERRYIEEAVENAMRQQKGDVLLSQKAMRERRKNYMKKKSSQKEILKSNSTNPDYLRNSPSFSSVIRSKSDGLKTQKADVQLGKSSRAINFSGTFSSTFPAIGDQDGEVSGWNAQPITQQVPPTIQEIHYSAAQDPSPGEGTTGVETKGSNEVHQSSSSFVQEKSSNMFSPREETDGKAGFLLHSEFHDGSKPLEHCSSKNSGDRLFVPSSEYEEGSAYVESDGDGEADKNNSPVKGAIVKGTVLQASYYRELHPTAVLDVLRSGACEMILKGTENEGEEIKMKRGSYYHSRRGNQNGIVKGFIREIDDMPYKEQSSSIGVGAAIRLGDSSARPYNPEIHVSPYQQHYRALQEREGDDMSVKWFMLCVETGWQLVFSLLLLPADALPWFGNSETVSDTWSNFIDGLNSVFTDRKNAIYGILFTLGFVFNYLGAAYLNHYSVALCSIVTQLSSPITALILVIVPKWNVHDEGTPQWYFSCLSIVFFSIAAVLYVMWEEQTEDEKKESEMQLKRYKLKL